MADLTRSIDATLAQEEEGAVVELNQPNGEPYRAADGSPATVTVLGRESRQVRAAIAANTRRLLRSKKGKMDETDLRANRVEAAVAAITDWHGWEADGIAAPCTPENVRQLLRADHLLEQVEVAIHGHADFFSTNSTD